jgi:phage shock protein PspC (stress-responsive transcriptional regulator)
MQKVVSISLNGIAFQLEEPGYQQLSDYLERADARLKDSPDRAEIMADLEQAIGEKCSRVIGPHKTVVSGAEINGILQEMGPVESAEQDKPADAAFDAAGGAGATSSAVPPQDPRKRLFKIREGAMFGGVCNGIAAYMGVDVTWVRIAAVLITLFTSGVVVLVYLGLMFIVPYANTSEDRAAAFGAPFSTQEFLGRAKKKPEDSREYDRWRREWRRQQRHWQRQWDHMSSHMSAQMSQATAQAAPYLSQGLTTGGRVAMAVFLPIAALIGAVVFVVFIIALISLITNQAVFGWDLPHDVPLWMGIIGLILLYSLVTIPIRLIRYGGQSAAAHPGWSALHSVLWICFTLGLLWLAYMFIPGLSETADQLMWATELTIDNLSATIH